MTKTKVLYTQWTATFAAGLAGVAAAFPLWWALISALRPEHDIFKYLSPLSVWTFLPNTISMSNFIALVGSPFGRAMMNSIIVSISTVIVGLIFCSMAGFALAKLRFPLKKTMFCVIVISFLVPFDAISVPLANLFRQFGLSNSYAGLVLPGVGNGFAVFLLRQFFLAVPADLSEAGRVDGLTWFGVFIRLYLPLSKPALIGAGLILFVFQWQSFLWPLLIAPDPEYKVASVAIADFNGQFNVSFGKTFAAAIFVSIVPLAILLFFQRYFITSFAASGSKE